jgi:hypothetical protein
MEMRSLRSSSRTVYRGRERESPCVDEIDEGVHMLPGGHVSSVATARANSGASKIIDLVEIIEGGRASR